jgi:hypothetical protein
MATTAAPRRAFHPAPAARVHHRRDHGLLPASHVSEVDPADVPLGRDHGLMLWIIALVLVVSVAVAPAALIDKTWVLVPLAALLIASTAWVTILVLSLASDPVD